MTSLMQNFCKRSCGFCGYCLARWCEMPEIVVPASDDRERCNCYEEGSSPDEVALGQEEHEEEEEDELGVDPVLQGSGGITVQAMFVGAGDSEAWEDLAVNFTDYVRALLPSRDDLGQTYRYGSTGSYKQVPDISGAWKQRPVVQQHWRSGTLAPWQAFEAPDLQVKTGNGVGTQTVLRLYCYCGGSTPCAATGAYRGGFFRKPKPALPITPDDGSEADLADNSSNNTGDAESNESDSGDGSRLLEAVAIDGNPDVSGLPPALGSLRGYLHTGSVDGNLDAPAEWASQVTYGRRLAPSLSTVTLVWGLFVRELGPFDFFVQTDVVQMWDFDPLFDPNDPWAQRAMMQMCENMPSELRVAQWGEMTWLRAYEDWLWMSKSEHFPSRNFATTIHEFLQNQEDHLYNFLQEDGQIRAARIDFKLELTDHAAAGIALETLAAWNRYVDKQNMIASVRANGAWHSSKLWVRAEAQNGIITSTATIICISVQRWARCACFAFLHGDVDVLAIGAIEVVALIVFLGYVFTFNLHIAHAYTHAPNEDGTRGKWRKVQSKTWGDIPDAVAAERYRRAKYAVQAMGRSLVGSATTSIGCAIFLLFCTLQFFLKFGIVIVLVSCLSLLYSLLFLPSLLMAAGPVPEQRCPCIRRSADADSNAPPAVPPPPTPPPPLPSAPSDLDQPPPTPASPCHEQEDSLETSVGQPPGYNMDCEDEEV
eukprot:CAMPEP_0115737242 /NCGR_PEP_ID=MMETSP0272-20121206/87713_1 /TAXON_ID=71861 /ORGANISM="Scrippsiella trochoidea, Strain CCMP3099" /LENGTH=708 /DNA_ID=CAMNT_0003181531 /DNA_START=69 /DNA_END=2196 /DNA_ORIENTATION=-